MRPAAVAFVRRAAVRQRILVLGHPDSLPDLRAGGALDLNILTGYAGQLSLGSAAFMAVGAYAAYNFQLRIEGMPILVSFISAV